MLRKIFEIGKLFYSSNMDDRIKNLCSNLDKKHYESIIYINICDNKYKQIEILSYENGDYFKILKTKKGYYTFYLSDIYTKDIILDNIISFLSSRYRNLKNEGIKNIIEIVKNNWNKILIDIKDITNNIPSSKRNKILVSFKFDNKYLNEISIFKDMFYDFLNKDTSKIKGVCHICNSIKEVEYKSNYTFSTIDKKGFVFGLNDKLSYMSFSICDDCFDIVQNGKSIIEQSLVTKYFGMTLMIIPSLFNISVKNEYLRKFINNIKKDIMEDDFVKNKMYEDYIFYKLKDENNNLFCDYIFFKKTNSAFKINTHIRNLNPSLISDFFNNIENTKNNEFLNKLFNNFERIPYYNSIDFDKLKIFKFEYLFNLCKHEIYDSKSNTFKNLNKDTYKMFLSFIDSILKKKPIDKNLLYSLFYKKFLFYKRSGNNFLCNKLFLKFYVIMTFISYTTGIIKEENYMGDNKDNLEYVIENSPLMKDSCECRYAFILGFLINRVKYLYEKNTEKDFDKNYMGLLKTYGNINDLRKIQIKILSLIRIYSFDNLKWLVDRLNKELLLIKRQKENVSVIGTLFMSGYYYIQGKKEEMLNNNVINKVEYDKSNKEIVEDKKCNDTIIENNKNIDKEIKETTNKHIKKVDKKDKNKEINNYVLF